MEQALNEGKKLYSPPTESENNELELKNGTISNPVSAKIFFLTDGSCASACLDFADIILNMPNVIHVGSETSADTLYMDVRVVNLPSGLIKMQLPMKVYRNRPRGNNISYSPKYQWNGEMDDTAGLEKWILDLDERL